MSQSEREGLKLLPCPFCGGPARICEDDSYGNMSVWCNACDNAPDGCVRIIAERDKAIAAWNTRAPAPELVEALAKVERYEKALGALGGVDFHVVRQMAGMPRFDVDRADGMDKVLLMMTCARRALTPEKVEETR